MKKLLSLLLAAILAFSLALPAFAADPAPGQYKVTYTDPSNHFQKREFIVKAGEKAPAYDEVKPQYGNSVFSTWNYRYKNITDPTTVTVNENITFTAYWEKLPELTPEIAKQKCLLRITDNERPGTGYDIKNGKLIDGTYSISKVDYDANNKVAYATVTIAAASFDAYSVNLEGGAGDYIYHFRELGEHAKNNTDSNGNLVIHLKSQGVYVGAVDQTLGLQFREWEMDPAYYPDKALPQLLLDRYYRVTYKDGANGAAFGDRVLEAKENSPAPAFGSDPTREGYKFTGWDKPVSDKVTEHLTYTAQWETNPYTVKYSDGIGGKAFKDESYVVRYGNPTPKFAGTIYPSYEIEGKTHVFKEWQPAVADTVTGDVTYVAQWEITGPNVIVYHGNGGVRANGSDVHYDQTLNATYLDVLSNSDIRFNRPDYRFVGWNTKADGSGDSYQPGDMVSFSGIGSDETVDLYAMWEVDTYTVSFNCNGGEACAPITVTYGEAYGRQLPACFVDGMQNLGWYLVDADGNVTDTYIGERTLVTEARNHELFQKREIKKPTVKLNLSRPVYNYLEEPVTIQSSGITEYPALKYSYQWYKDGTALTDGKIYEGSNTANLTLKHDYVSCSGLYKLVVTISVADNSGIVSANGTVTAEADYDLLIRRSSNMVIYDANGGQGGPLNDSDYYDKANDRYIAKLRGVDAIPDSPPVREGYHFLGWNTKADGTGDSYKPGDFYVFDRELSENGGLRVTLYAMWEACADHLVDVKVLKAPTCTEKGLKLCRCKVCGVEYEVEMPALGHDLSGWIWNRTEHWKKCRRCGELFEVDKHILTEWKDILRNGEIVPEHHCVVCGFSECGSVIHIDGTKKPQAGVEVNPPTGAEVPSVLPALAVLAGAAVLLRKKK